ncbi:MAG TPA: YitT family protein [Paenibacillus sp.]|uniref:YitT family protein n=1 Tax=Paenibacillus sp. TaxID=58172 RepID=UPI002C6897FE|nr:YitT family protein [Paenibacillus sp.]HUC93542.1 YitT family protein [Paenibacillus sp.]
MNAIRSAGSLAGLTVGAFLIAFGFNQMLIPHRLLSGGLSGVAMMLGYATGWPVNLMYFALNVPVLAWGWFVLGRSFVLWSIYSVAAATFLMQFTPVSPLVTDPVLGAVFGGVIFGFGSGLSLRFGGSSGGFDVIASVVTRKRDIPVGMLLFLLNGAVIGTLALQTGDWDIVLYSMLSIFAAGKVVDLVHIRQVKVTAFIITRETEKLLDKLLTLERGVTVIRTRGAYDRTEKDMLMTVTTRYELAALRRTIRTLDPKAFVNIVETVGVIGEFRRI